MKKRGQVTTFVIIGIVLILLVGGFFVVKNYFLKEEFDVSEERLGRIPEQIRPVASYLDSCVANLAKEAVDFVSAQGGYVDVPVEEIPTSSIAPLGASVEIIPGTQFKVPLWYRQRPNGVEELNVPSLRDVEGEISNYVKENYVVCLEGLATYYEQGYELTSLGSNVDVDTKITRSKVNVNVNYPISAKVKGVDFTIKSSGADVDSSFGDLYESAKEILNKQNEVYFFEKKTLELLVANDPVIPFKGVSTKCVQDMWLKRDVVSKLKEKLELNVGAIRVKDTDYQSGAHKLMEFDGLVNENEDIVVNFMYSPEWPTYVEIIPNEGEILKSESAGQDSFVASVIQSFFCMNSHYFVYDIKYPVVATLRDKETGDMLQFGFEVIIDNNQARENREPAPLGVEVENLICEGKGADLFVATKTIGRDGSLVNLDGVDVKYKCYPAKCDVGVSKMTAAGEPVVYGKVPFCSGGVVEGSKEGFFKAKEHGVSTNIKGQQEVVLVLEPIYKKNVVVKVVDKGRKELRDPYDSEQITFNFINKDTGYSTTLLYPDQKEVSLVVGNYDVKSTVVGETTWDLTTKKEKVKKCVDANMPGILGVLARGREQCTEIEIEPVNFEKFAPKGGVNFEFGVDRNNLAAANDLILYTVAENPPGTMDEMSKLQLRVETNAQSKDFIYPEFR